MPIQLVGVLVKIGLPLDLLRRLRIVVDYSVLPWNCLQSHERALNWGDIQRFLTSNLTATSFLKLLLVIWWRWPS